MFSMDVCYECDAKLIEEQKKEIWQLKQVASENEKNKKKDERIFYLSPKGKKLDQKLALELSKEKGLPRMMSVQNPYNLLNRTYEVGLAEISIRDDIGLLAYSPLASGYLTGKYRNNQLPKNSRIERDGNFWTRYEKPNTKKAVDAYYEISKKHNLDLTQMSLKFCEIQPFMTSVIIGATTMEQLKTDIESVNINLSEEVIKEINEVQTIYPNPCP